MNNFETYLEKYIIFGKSKYTTQYILSNFLYNPLLFYESAQTSKLYKYSQSFCLYFDTTKCQIVVASLITTLFFIHAKK